MATGAGSRPTKGQAAHAPLIGRQIELARGRPAADPDSDSTGARPLNTKTAKFHRLIKLLQDSGPGLSIRQMASALAVDERTVKRYLADLRRLRFDLIQENDSRGRRTQYRIQGTGGPPVHLLSSLRKIRSELHAGGNPKHSSAISQVIKYLEDPAGAASAGRRASVPARAPTASPEPAGPPGPDVYHIDHGPFAEADPSSGILKILETAVGARTAVRLTYSGYAKAASQRPEAEEILFFPYVLCLRVGTLYVIGRQGENRGPFKSFSVRRIRRCIATRDVFKADPFDPADFYRYTFGQWHRQPGEEPETVVFAVKAPWLEKYLSESRFNPPGRILRRAGEALFEVKVVIKTDFINWVLSLSPDLVPLKPDSLRTAVQERLRKGLEAVS